MPEAAQVQSYLSSIHWALGFQKSLLHCCIQVAWTHFVAVVTAGITCPMLFYVLPGKTGQLPAGNGPWLILSPKPCLGTARETRVQIRQCQKHARVPSLSESRWFQFPQFLLSVIPLSRREAYVQVSFFMTYKCMFLQDTRVTHDIYREIWNSFFIPGWLFKRFTTVSGAWLLGSSFLEVQADVAMFVSKETITSYWCHGVFEGSFIVFVIRWMDLRTGTAFSFS